MATPTQRSHFMATPTLHCPTLVTPPTQVLEAQQAKLSFFTTQRLQDILHQLITHFMVLSKEVRLSVYLSIHLSVSPLISGMFH